MAYPSRDKMKIFLNKQTRDDVLVLAQALGLTVTPKATKDTLVTDILTRYDSRRELVGMQIIALFVVKKQKELNMLFEGTTKFGNPLITPVRVEKKKGSTLIVKLKSIKMTILEFLIRNKVLIKE